MAKKKTQDQDPEEEKQHPIRIVSASLKDGLCNYTYEIRTGLNSGDQHTVKGKGIATQDLYNAFDALRKHLACIDLAFRMSGIEDDIDTLATHELVDLYTVNGAKFKHTGSELAVEILGIKYSSVSGGHISISTPMVNTGLANVYPHFDELKRDASHLIDEVYLYSKGKFVVPDKDDDKDDPNQIKMFENGDVPSFESAEIK